MTGVLLSPEGSSQPESATQNTMKELREMVTRLGKFVTTYRLITESINGFFASSLAISRKNTSFSDSDGSVKELLTEGAEGERTFSCLGATELQVWDGLGRGRHIPFVLF